MKLARVFKLILGAVALAIFYLLKVYAITALTVLFVLAILFFCLRAIWVKLFSNWHPRGYFKRRRAKKLMEFTNSRHRP